LIDKGKADEVPFKVKELLKAKERQTKVMLQKLSLVRINYIFKCLKSMNKD
jgi:hypothetical protein